ncbi:Protein bcn92 [Pseudolycoriella hygida]|uniref:Protein bcn92 n=1 Tax=Pseudolycoriella hygida TaxID=35572 RepID=A0A9Q0MTJ2_9DIPT|nr:Protein bcn92 [Pseudolycoriella hygida]
MICQILFGVYLLNIFMRTNLCLTVMSSRTKVLNLYRSLLRESEKFSSYNFRNYAKRRIRDGFKSKKDLADALAIQSELEFGNKNLDIIHRQVIVGHLYASEKLVIEKNEPAVSI